MKNISKRKQREGYKKTQTTMKEEWTPIVTKSKAGVEYTKLKRTLVHK